MSDPLCAACSQAITGDILRYGSATYHVDHLLCTSCKCQLGAGVAIKNFSGKPHCSPCWSKAFYGAGGVAAGSVPAGAVANPSPAAAPVPAPKKPAAPEEVAPAHPLKDHLEGASQLKHVAIAKDASAPRVEPVQIKKVDREAFKNEVAATAAKPAALKHVEPEKTHDASAPKIEPGTTIKERPMNQRAVFLGSLERAASNVASATPMEKAVRTVETAARMIEAAQHSVESNKRNVQDAIAKTPGASSEEEAKKALATAEDLLQTQIKNAQVRYNASANEAERSKAELTGDLGARWTKALAVLKSHGLAIV